MCDSCGKDGADAYSNWLLHHRPYELEVKPEEVSIRDHAIDVLLTLRFETITVEEIMSNYGVSEDKARELSRMCNTIMTSMEDFLITMLNH